MLLTAAFVFAWPWTRVRLPQVSLPEGALCPATVRDGNGLHVVYGAKGLPYYERSADFGKTFTTPLRLAGEGFEGDVGHERGPLLAIGKGGTVHVLWMNSPKAKVFYTRSSDGGRTFAPARNLTSPSAGVDGATLAADASGRVFVVWAESGATQAPDSPASKTLTYAFSRDDGATFSSPQPLASDYPGGVCSCCALHAAIGADHQLLVAARGAHNNLRDIYLFRAAEPTARFESSRVSPDDWIFQGCPMAGPWIDAATPGAIHVAWMSKDEVYHATSRDGGRTFDTRTAPASAASGRRTLPFILSNPAGEQLFAWVQNRRTLWQRIGADGRVVDGGDNGSTEADSRIAAFADPTGRFVLVR